MEFHLLEFQVVLPLHPWIYHKHLLLQRLLLLQWLISYPSLEIPARHLVAMQVLLTYPHFIQPIQI